MRLTENGCIHHPTIFCECVFVLEAERDRLVSELKGKEARLKYECDEVNRLKADNENLIWNLAGCSTFALGYGVNESFDEKSARPALTDVLALRKKYDHLRSLAQGMAREIRELSARAYTMMRYEHKIGDPPAIMQLDGVEKALALWDAYEKEQNEL